MKQSEYSNFIDLRWYFSVCLYLGENDRFGFPKVPCDPSVTVDSMLSDLDAPQDLPIERQRALALAAAGTDFETEALVRIIVTGTMDNLDLYFTAACACLRDKALRVGAQRMLSERVYVNLEEKLLALQSYRGNDIVGLETLLVSTVRDLQADVETILKHKEAIQNLMELNDVWSVKSEFLSYLRRAIATVPDTNKVHYSVLWKYGFTVLDVSLLIWFFRGCSKSDESSLTGKSGKAIRNLKNELAQHFKEWKPYEKRIVEEVFGGKIGFRISNAKNYKWYYGVFGMRFPELSLLLSDKRGTERKLSVLSDLDRCRIAAYMQLSREDTAVLGLKFSEWSPELVEYFNTNFRGFAGAHRCYYPMEESILDLTDVTDLKAKYYYCKGISKEEGAYVAGIAKKYSLKFFVDVVKSSGCMSLLSEEDKELYYDFVGAGYRFVEQSDCLTEFDFRSPDYPYNQFPELFALYQSGVNLDDLHYREMPRYEKILSKTSEDKAEVFKVLQRVFVSGEDLAYFLDSGCILSDLKDYADWRHTEYTTRDGSFRKFALSDNTKKFRDWAGVSLKDCYMNFDTANSLHYEIYLHDSLKNERYRETLSGAVRAWIVDGTPMHELLNVHPLSRNGGYQKDVLEFWESHATKNLHDAGTIADMNCVIGVIDGIECAVTNIGILVFDEGSIDRATVPVWRISSDPDAEKMSVFFSGSYGESSYRLPNLNKSVISDTCFTLSVERVA